MKKLLALLASVISLAAAEVITWDSNPVADNVTSYRVYFIANPATPLPWTLLATVASTNTLAATNNAAGRFYYYVVANNGSDSDPSDVAFRPGKPPKPKVQ